MARKNIQEDPRQFSFDAFGQIIVPKTIDWFIHGIILPQQIFSEKLWHEIPQGDGIIIDLERGQGAVFDPRSKLIKYPYLGNTPPSRDKFAAALIIISSPIYDGERLSQTVANVRLRLKNDKSGIGALYIYERVGGSVSQKDLHIRGTFLQSSGFVEVKIRKTPQSGNVLWEGRLRKPFHPQAKDLYLYPRYQKLIPQLMKKMEKDYQRQGFSLLGISEITERLHNSIVPPKDMEALRRGFGVMLEARCGCQYKIDINGDGGDKPVWACNEHPFGGSPKAPNLTTTGESVRRTRSPIILDRNRDVPSGLTCGCGEQILIDTKVIKINSGNPSLLSINAYCPSCGRSNEVRQEYGYLLPDGKVSLVNY